MEPKNDIKAFYARTRQDWRKWLEENHKTEKNLFLILYHKKSKKECISYNDAVEEALCYGWVDSKANKRDTESYYLFFAQRKPGSGWAKSNRERAEKLIEQGLMTEAGQYMIDHAKRTGTWTILEEVRNLIIPDDLQEQFNNNPTAFNNFQGFSASSRQIILAWILNAKKPETRLQRIHQTVELANKNIRANHNR